MFQPECVTQFVKRGLRKGAYLRSRRISVLVVKINIAGISSFIGIVCVASTIRLLIECKSDCIQRIYIGGWDKMQVDHRGRIFKPSQSGCFLLLVEGYVTSRKISARNIGWIVQPVVWKLC